MQQEQVRGRFAPSPSGRMHLGNLFAALLAWLDVRSLGGKLLMRLEDLDPARSRWDMAELLADDLLWLGLGWDEGWQGARESIYVQSCRTERYAAAFADLQQRGLVYPCYCSRAERLAASAPHPGEQIAFSCRCSSFSARQQMQKEAEGRKPAWKVRAASAKQAVQDVHYGEFCRQPEDAGDFIICRADGVYAYQLAVSVDDAEMQVSRVVRARDLLPSAIAQQWLISELGYLPPRYCHTPLLVAEDGRKLSKREGDLSMQLLRKRFSPPQIIGLLAHLSGLLPEWQPVCADELIPIFSWEKVPKEDIIISSSLLQKLQSGGA